MMPGQKMGRDKGRKEDLFTAPMSFATSLPLAGAAISYWPGIVQMRWLGGTIHLNHLASKSSRNIRYRFFSDNENVLGRVFAPAEADSCNVEGEKASSGEKGRERRRPKRPSRMAGEAAQQRLGDPSHQSPRQLRQPQEATEGKAQNRGRAAWGTLTMEAYNPTAAEPMGLSTVPLPYNNKSHKERNWLYLVPCTYIWGFPSQVSLSWGLL